LFLVLAFLVFFLITTPPQPSDYVGNAGGYVGIFIFATALSFLIEIIIHAYSKLAKSEEFKTCIVLLIREFLSLKQPKKRT
jgi:hypothetical protein